jgi:hypothetical protein
MSLKLLAIGIALALLLGFLLASIRRSNQRHWNRVQRAAFDRWKDQADELDRSAK